MSDYPDYNQIHPGSVRQESFPMDVGRSENGTPLIVSKGDTIRYRWTLRHLINDSEFQAIMTLYRARQRANQQPQSFTFTCDQDSTEYEVRFSSTPQRVKVGVDLYQVSTDLVQA